MRQFRILLVACVFVCIGVTPAAAQVAPPAADAGAATVPVEQLERLKTTLQDEKQRAALIANIEALIAVEKQQASDADEAGGRLGREMVKLLADAQDGLHAVPPLFNRLRADADQFLAWAERTWRDPAQRSDTVRRIALFAGIFAAGWLVEYGLWMLLSPVRRRLMTRAPPSVNGRVRSGLQRAAIEMLPIIGFFAAATAFGVIGGSATRLTAAGLVLALVYGSVRALLAFVRLVLAPRAAGLRLASLTTPVAVDLYRWLQRIVLVIAIATLAVLWSRIAGLPPAAERWIAGIAVLSASVILAVFVLAQSGRWNAWLAARIGGAGGGTSGALLFRGVVRAGPALMLAFIVGLAAVILLRIDGGVAVMLHGFLGTVLALGLGGLAIGGLGRARSRADAIAATAESSSPWRTAAPYLSSLLGLGRVVVLVVVLLGVLQSWGIATFGWLLSPSGQRWIGSGASIVLILAIAVLVWQGLSAAITRRLDRLEASGTVAARARTLLPLVRRVLFIVFAFTVGMVVLSEIGVAVAPLLAGAGIVGLAVGFGAQKLVQDVINGIFILLENSVAIGDVVTVAGIGGLVEDLSIRSIRLRDLSGNVHTIPFSSVDTVTNMTRDFSYYLLDIGVAYREDTDAVAEVCRQIVDEMRAEAAFAPFILEPLEVLGIDQFTDSAVIIKARIKTPPIKQWLVGREFNRRMKKRFDELGIEIPFPHRTLYFGVGKNAEAPAASERLDCGGDRPDVSPVSPPVPAPPATSAAAPSGRSVAADPDADRER